MDDQAWDFHVRLCPKHASRHSSSPAGFFSWHYPSLCFLRFRVPSTVPHKTYSSICVQFRLQNLHSVLVRTTESLLPTESTTFTCDTLMIFLVTTISLEVNHWSFLALAKLTALPNFNVLAGIFHGRHLPQTWYVSWLSSNTLVISK